MWENYRVWFKGLTTPCVILVYSLNLYCLFTIWVLQVNILHMARDTGTTHVIADECVILIFYTCNTHENTTYVLHVGHNMRQWSASYTLSLQIMTEIHVLLIIWTLLYLSQMLKHSEIHLCTKVPFHGTVCHIILKMLPTIIVLKGCISKSIFMHPHSFIAQQDHI